MQHLYSRGHCHGHVNTYHEKVYLKIDIYLSARLYVDLYKLVQSFI